MEIPLISYRRISMRGDGMEAHKTAAVFKALGDENRIRILKILSGGEKCACKRSSNSPNSLTSFRLLTTGFIHTVEGESQFVQNRRKL